MTRTGVLSSPLSIVPGVALAGCSKKRVTRRNPHFSEVELIDTLWAQMIEHNPFFETL